MSAAAILDEARGLGVNLRVEGDTIKAKGPRQAVARLLPALREHKPELLAALAKTDPASDPARNCADCVSVTRHGDCRRPVEARLSMRFELIAAPEAYAGTCPAFEPKSGPPGHPDELCGHWLIALPPERLERWFSPAVTRAELEQRYPGAVLIALPESTGDRRPATPEQLAELHRLITAVAAQEGFSEAERAEALTHAKRDPEGAMRCFRGLLNANLNR